MLSNRIVLLAFALSVSPIWGDGPLPEALKKPVDFNRDVAPLLERCQACHGAGQQMSGLRLDSRAAALAGGYSGPVIKPGDSAGSKLIRLVSGTGKIVMPPAGGRLTAGQVGILRAWIDQGVKWPESAAIKTIAPTPARSHWAFTPPLRPDIPAVRNRAWLRNPIDAFVLARLEAERIEPSPEADRRTLIRRVSLDLIGLPPKPEDVAAFVADNRPDAYERLVDRLLASPQYGEKWARQWLDMARYADSDGYEKDLPRPFAWRYRDWVIDALNQNMPFDEFTIEQIAGDLLPNATLSQKIATGFHRNTLTNREGGIDREQLRVEQVVDRTSTVGTVWLGLTVGCAQCHDHKFDPITQKDFYSLSAFFNSAEEVDIEAPRPGEMGPYLQGHPACAAKRSKLLEEHQVPALQAEWEPKVIEAGRHPGKYGGDWDLAWTVLWNDERAILLKDPARRTEKERDKLTDHFLEWYSAVVSKERYAELKFKELRAELQKLNASCPQLSDAPAMAEAPSPRPTWILMRGDFRAHGTEVQPATPAFLPHMPAEPHPSRLTLARWLVAKNNPLTARVAVNRMWQAFFGRGLVSTSEDFGKQGERPTHPELLDWLAVEFMDRGWDVKQMHKLIVQSATYRQASTTRKELQERDPYNLLLARQSRLRLEAELLRDAALEASGLLNPEIGGPSVYPPEPAGVISLGYGDFVKWPESKGTQRYRRGLYTFFQRSVPYPMLVNFDAPNSELSCTRRIRSTTPLQALNLLNDPVFFEAAQALAARILRDKQGGLRDRIRYGFELCLARDPSQGELDRVSGYFEKRQEMLKRDSGSSARIFPGKLEGTDPAETGAWVGVSRALLNLDEFMTRE